MSVINNKTYRKHKSMISLLLFCFLYLNNQIKFSKKASIHFVSSCRLHAFCVNNDQHPSFTFAGSSFYFNDAFPRNCI